MSIFQAFLLGIVQGITEFLPVSSSAHLVLVPYWLDWQVPADQVFIFDVVIQMGTLVAVIVYFWKDLVQILRAVFRGIAKRKPLEDADAKLGWLIILATIPGGIAGVVIKKHVEAVFHSPMMTAMLLLLTAALLILAEIISKRSRPLESLTWLDALIIGIFQAVAIFPGISRSGATMTGGLVRGFDRDSSARFSFLMSIPIMFAAGFSQLLNLGTVQNPGSFIPALAIGLITAGVVGFFSIKWLLKYLRSHSMTVFAIVCILSWLITYLVSLNRL